MGNNLKQKCIGNKEIITSTYIGVPLHQSSGKEALFQQLFTALTQDVPVKDILLFELHRIRQIFHRVNGCPNRFLSNIMNQVKTRQARNSNQINENIKKLFCYHTKEKKGSTIMKRLSKE